MVCSTSLRVTIVWFHQDIVKPLDLTISCMIHDYVLILQPQPSIRQAETEEY